MTNAIRWTTAQWAIKAAWRWKHRLSFWDWVTSTFFAKWKYRNFNEECGHRLIMEDGRVLYCSLRYGHAEGHLFPDPKLQASPDVR